MRHAFRHCVLIYRYFLSCDLALPVANRDLATFVLQTHETFRIQPKDLDLESSSGHTSLAKRFDPDTA